MRTEAQWMVLNYMRGHVDVIPLSTDLISRVLDELVQRGDLSAAVLPHRPFETIRLEYHLTDQGRRPDDSVAAPVEPDPPLTPAEGRHLSFNKTREGQKHD